MIATRPRVAVDGDPLGKPMANHPELMGLNLQRAVWRFGFEPGTALAVAFSCTAVRPVLVMAWLNGHVIETFMPLTWAESFPLRFCAVLRFPAPARDHQAA